MQPATHRSSTAPVPLRLLGSLLPSAEREEVLGDLREEYAERREARGRAAAAVWLWRQVLGSVILESLVIGVLASVVGAFYYLRIIKIMWFDEPVGGFLPMPGELRVVLGVSGAFMLLYVVVAGPIGTVAQAAARTFF